MAPGSRRVAANNAAGSALIGYNAITPAFLQSLGLDITNAATRTLLTSTITSADCCRRRFQETLCELPG